MKVCTRCNGDPQPMTNFLRPNLKRRCQDTLIEYGTCNKCAEYLRNRRGKPRGRPEDPEYTSSVLLNAKLLTKPLNEVGNALLYMRSTH